jgi:hypothetical protein
MRSVPWSRDVAVAEVRAEIWRYVSAASRREDLVLQAAALLGMAPAEVRSLARIQFVTSDEVGELLEAMPELVRRPTTTTKAEREQSADRVRGALQWGPTYGARAATGNPMVHVTAPARRAYQTPENELVVFLLSAIVRVAQNTRWVAKGADWAGRLVRERHDAAVRWLGVSAFQEVRAESISHATVARVRNGRSARRLATALRAHARYAALVDKVDLDAVRKAVEQDGLVTREDDKLLELQVLFGVERALAGSGWEVSAPRLMMGTGGSVLGATRDGEQLEVFFQRSLARVAGVASSYASVQRSHSFARASQMIPDLVLRHETGGRTRWILLEVKGGTGRVERYARAALGDLLAYRQDSKDLFPDDAVEPFGLGVAWGAELTPELDGPIALCTPDTLAEAVEGLFANAREDATSTG